MNLDRNLSRGTRYAALIGKAELSKPVLIVGAGALGATIARELATIGFTNLTIYDHDKVEPVNLGPQGFRFSHLGLPKVEAVAIEIADLNPQCVVDPVHELFTADSEVDPHYAVFCAVDSLQARRQIFEAWEASSAEVFIDARLDVYDFERYTVQRGSEFDYLSTIGQPSTLNTPCTMRMTRQTTLVAAALCIQSLWDVLCVGDVLDNTVLFNVMSLDVERSPVFFTQTEVTP